MKYNVYIPWKLLLVTVAFLVLVPLLVVFVDIQEFDIPMASFLMRNNIPTYVVNTFIILSIVVGITVLLGSSIAWLCAVYHFPARKYIIFLQVFPLLVPSYIGAITWRNAFSFDGFMTTLFGSSSFLGQFMSTLPSFVILVFVLSCNLYPFVFFVQYIFFSKLPQSLFDVAKSMNRKTTNLFISLAMPLSFVSMISISVLICMELMNEQWTYQYLGYEILSTGILRVLLLYQNLSIAKILSFMVVLVMIMLFLYKSYIEKKQHVFRSSKITPLRLNPLSKKKVFFTILCCIIPVILGFVIPTMQLLFWAFPIFTSGRVASYVVQPLLNTLLLSGIVISIQIPLSILLSFASRLCNKNLYRTSFSLISISYAIPSVIIAILILSVIRWIDTLFFSVEVFPLFVSAGIYALIIACVYRYIPIALAPINIGFHHANVRYEEASRSMGASPLKTLFTICIPINKGFIYTAMMLTVIEIIKDIPIASILRPYNFETLAIKVRNLVNSERLSESSVAALALIAVGILVSIPAYKGLVEKRTM